MRPSRRGEALRALGLAGLGAVLVLPPLLSHRSALRTVVAVWLLVGVWLTAFVVLRWRRQRRERARERA